MFAFVFIAFVWSIISDEDFVVTKELISKINNDPTSTWVAGVNPRFVGKTWGEVKKTLQWQGHSKNYRRYTSDGKKVNLPTEFDAYKKWPNCAKFVRNQGACGSCWAFSAAEAMSDRFCISGKDTILSPQDLVSCDKQEYACQGGYLSTEWEYFEKTGVVTDRCFHYQSSGGDVPSCPYKCEDGEDWKASKHFTKKNTTVHFTKVEDAMNAIFTDGPIQAGFTVYQDFFSYKSGVYVHKTGPKAGGHAVKLQGWGVSDGEEYWLVANSWGEFWGLDGYFWIKRGVDECGFEEQLYAALPLL